jgi:ribosomal protein L37AE/L43A
MIEVLEIVLGERRLQSTKSSVHLGSKLSKGCRGRPRKELSQRPKCPRCGAENPISEGKVWGCKSCGGTWRKKHLKEDG